MAFLEAIAPYLRPRTVESYTWALNRHILPALGSQMVRRIARVQVKSLVRGLLVAGKALNTVKIIHVCT